MLVLSRKKGEQIRIGDNIVITVHRISGNRVSVGIEAPADCRIVRGELQAIAETVADKAEPTPNVVRRVLKQITRPTPNVAAEPSSENRIAQHLPSMIRTAK
jgi:carbon storage regulator CsrA